MGDQNSSEDKCGGLTTSIQKGKRGKATKSISSLNKGKNRTPSGQILGTSVKDIRNFFQQEKLSQDFSSKSDQLNDRSSMKIVRNSQDQWSASASASASDDYDQQSVDSDSIDSGSQWKTV